MTDFHIVPAAEIASMRPRQSSLGNGTTRRGPSWPTTSFNEAEAIKPRKPGASCPRPTRRSPRFNEAEAIKPRKPAHSPGAGGNEYRFNEAEAIKPRKLPEDQRRFMLDTLLQ